MRFVVEGVESIVGKHFGCVKMKLSLIIPIRGKCGKCELIRCDGQRRSNKYP